MEEGIAVKVQSSLIPATPVPATNRWLTGDGESMLAVEHSRSFAIQAVLLDITRTFDISFVPDLVESMRNRPGWIEPAG